MLKELLGCGLEKIESWGKPLRVHLQRPLLQRTFYRRVEGLVDFVSFWRLCRPSALLLRVLFGMPYLWCKSSNDVPNWALSSKARRILSSRSSFFAALALTRGMVAVVRRWIKNSRRGGVSKCGVWVRTDEFCAIPLLVVSDFRVSYVTRKHTHTHKIYHQLLDQGLNTAPSASSM